MSSRPLLPLRSPSFWDSLATQGRVIGALILRELHTRYGRENVGYLWMIGEPMMLASVIGLLHIATGHTEFGSDMRPLPFAVLGYTVFILFRGIVNRSEGSLEANTPLLYHRQVTILDLTIARAVLEFAGVFLTFVILMSLIVCLGFGNPPARPLVLLGAWGLMFWYAFAHSVVITAISHDNRTIGRLVHPYSYFMVGLSAAFFQIAWLPQPFRTILTYIPITSILELARYGQFQAANDKYAFVSYVVAASAFLTWTGLVQMRLLRYKIHLT